MEKSFDIVVIGGGINGCGIAADAAMRGLKVLLVEAGDLAGKTSSASSKLIHGGLRYLEHYDVALVRKSLQERKILLQVARHLVHPLPIVLPYAPQRRKTWWIRLGLFVYDHLVWSQGLPHSQSINAVKQPPYFTPLQNNIQNGSLFYDCKTDDARLTITNALQARAYGAEIRLHTQLLEAKARNARWQLKLQSVTSTYEIDASVVINATGPWVNQVNHRLNIAAPRPLSLVKGSHILVPKWYSGQQAYLLQQPDNRVIFVVPYTPHYVLIGTTEVTLESIPQDLTISEEETLYLLDSVAHYFAHPPTLVDVVHSWSGIRPLATHDRSQQQNNPSVLPRDYVIHHTTHPAPALLIYGGKLTTYRQLAEETIDTLQYFFPDLPPSRTSTIPLPGSNIPEGLSWEAYQQQTLERFSWLDTTIVLRLLSQYGTQIESLLCDCSALEDLGIAFGQGLYEKEVLYLYHQEWATSAEDILWRRTHLGLVLSKEKQAQLVSYLAQLLAPL